MTKQHRNQSIERKQGSSGSNTTGKQGMPGGSMAHEGSGKSLGSRSRQDSDEINSRKGSKESYSGSRSKGS